MSTRTYTRTATRRTVQDPAPKRAACTAERRRVGPVRQWYRDRAPQVNPLSRPSQPLAEFTHGNHPVLALFDRRDASRPAQLMDIRCLHAQEFSDLDGREVAQVLERLRASLRGRAGEREDTRPDDGLQALERCQEMLERAGLRRAACSFECFEQLREALVEAPGRLGSHVPPRWHRAIACSIDGTISSVSQ